MALYVADFFNDRVHKFMINGNGTGITVAGGNGAGGNGAGGNGAGLGLNQLYRPVGVWVSRKDGSVYVGE